MWERTGDRLFRVWGLGFRVRKGLGLGFRVYRLEGPGVGREHGKY